MVGQPSLVERLRRCETPRVTQMKLLPGDKIIACLFGMPKEPCHMCGQTGYGVIVVQSSGENQRKVALCGKHFIQACDLYPELREMAQTQLDLGKSTAVPRAILCPKCWRPLDLGLDAAYDIILATGLTCNHCGAALSIQHNIARPEK